MIIGISIHALSNHCGFWRVVSFHGLERLKYGQRLDRNWETSCGFWFVDWSSTHLEPSQ